MDINEALALAVHIEGYVFAEKVLVEASTNDIKDQAQALEQSKQQFDLFTGQFKEIKEYFESFKEILENAGLAHNKENVTIQISDILMGQSKQLSEKTQEAFNLMTALIANLELIATMSAGLHVNTNGLIRQIQNVLTE